MENNIATSDGSKEIECSAETHLTKREDGETINNLPSTSKRNHNDLNDYSKKLKNSTVNIIETPFIYTDEDLNQTSFYFENGLRKVVPFHFTFEKCIEHELVGKKLKWIFKKYEASLSKINIECTSFTVNNKRVTPEYILKPYDVLTNLVHWHEPPVTSDKIDIIHIDEDIVVINKPSSIPIDYVNNYMFNTIIFILAKEYNLKHLKPVHYHDTLTSGVLIFGRTLNKIQQLEDQFRNKKVKKQYICRVDGKFPESIECKEPMYAVNNKYIIISRVSSNGKKCHTLFQLMGYNEKSNTSIVMCIPYTDRMHQIRVHLQFLGFPITNDILYNNIIFGSEKGRGGDINKSNSKLLEALTHAAKNSHIFKHEMLTCQQILPEDNMDMPNSEEREENNDRGITIQEGINMTFIRNNSIDDLCKKCTFPLLDPKPKNITLYQHAFKYSGPDWSYETPMPIWADANWLEPSS